MIKEEKYPTLLKTRKISVENFLMNPVYADLLIASLIVLFQHILKLAFIYYAGCL